MSIEAGIKEVLSFLKERGISDENIRILNQGSKKITWTFTGREKQCDRVMFFVSPGSLQMFILFLKIQVGECRISFVSQLKANEFVPTIQTEIDKTFSIEQFKSLFLDTEKKWRFKDLEKKYGISYHRECCDLFLEKNPDFLKMMDGIFGLNFEQYINSLKK